MKSEFLRIPFSKMIIKQRPARINIYLAILLAQNKHSRPIQNP